MRQSTMRRVEKVTPRRPVGCPPVAMGFEVSPGIYEIAGKRYTEDEIRRCFPRQLFIVLDDGPTRAGEKPHGQ